MYHHKKLASHLGLAQLGVSWQAAKTNKCFSKKLFLIFSITIWKRLIKNSRYDVNITVGPHGPHGGLHAITPPRNGPHAYKIPNRNPDLSQNHQTVLYVRDSQ